MGCTVDIYTDYLISSTGQVSATGLSRLYDGAISHDQVTRMLTNEYLDSTDLWRKAKPLIRQAEQAQKNQEFAVLIVDDTIIEKLYTDESALITTYWDHSHKRYVKGVNLLSLFYHLNELALPIAAQLIEKSQPQLDKKTQKDQIQKRVHQKRVLPADAPSRPAAGRLQVPACRLLVRFQRKHELCAGPEAPLHLCPGILLYRCPH